MFRKLILALGLLGSIAAYAGLRRFDDLVLASEGADAPFYSWIAWLIISAVLSGGAVFLGLALTGEPNFVAKWVFVIPYPFFIGMMLVAMMLVERPIFEGSTFEDLILALSSVALLAIVGATAVLAGNVWKRSMVATYAGCMVLMLGALGFLVNIEILVGLSMAAGAATMLLALAGESNLDVRWKWSLVVLHAGCIVLMLGAPSFPVNAQIIVGLSVAAGAMAWIGPAALACQDGANP